MKSTRKAAVIGSAILAAVAFSSTGAFAASSCKNIGAQGTGITEGIAKDQAAWQLSDASKGMKAKSKAKTSCKADGLIHTCVITQKYCK